MVEDLSFPKKYFVGEMQNFEGKQSIKTGKIPYFSLAGEEFNAVTSHDLPKFEDDYGIGLLGSGLLRKYTIIFDYENEIMAFKKLKGVNTDTPIDRSGLKIEPHINGGVVIAVAENTGADQLNLSPGDVITHINDTAITETNFDQLRLSLSSNLDSLPICWQHKQVKKCDQLPLASRI